MEPPDPLVALKGVRFTYPNGAEALRGVDVALHAGEIVALMGGNGSGKTTLAKILLGLLRPTAGSVIVSGLDATTAPTSELAKHAGLVFQNPDNQIFEKTVWDEVAFGPRNYALTPPETAQRVEEQLRTFDLTQYAQRLPTSLSVGERKAVAFASTFAMKPEVLLLDEPTRGMDYQRKRRLAAIARELKDHGRTVVFITHDVEFAYSSTDRTIVLDKGRVLLDGKTRSVLADPLIEEAGLQVATIPRIASLLLGTGPLPSLERVEDVVDQLEASLR